MTCRVVTSFAAAMLSMATLSSLAAEALTSNIPPFSIEQGPAIIDNEPFPITTPSPRSMWERSTFHFRETNL